MSPEEALDRAERRIKKMGDRELIGWLESALSGMQRHLDEYQKTDEVAHLGEIIIADVTLAAVLAEMTIRHKARKQEGLA